MWIAGFSRKVFILFWFISEDADLLHGLFCFVLCLSQFLISNRISVRTLYGPVRERVSGPSLVRDIGIKIDKCMSNKVRLSRWRLFRRTLYGAVGPDLLHSILF